jgi:hypothetical protein
MVGLTRTEVLTNFAVLCRLYPNRITSVIVRDGRTDGKTLTSNPQINSRKLRQQDNKPPTRFDINNHPGLSLLGHGCVKRYQQISIPVTRPDDRPN